MTPHDRRVIRRRLERLQVRTAESGARKSASVNVLERRAGARELAEAAALDGLLNGRAFDRAVLESLQANLEWWAARGKANCLSVEVKRGLDLQDQAFALRHHLEAAAAQPAAAE